MNEKDNFALVPKPPSAVEKVAPGAKRVLSGMVADTLALAKREPPKRRGTLLIVDDEEYVRLLMQMVFKDEYDLLMAEYGVMAIKVVQENDIDVVMTNIHMPGMSGIELLERLKFAQPDIEVIMATGFATTGTLFDALRFGACDYISKPCEIATIRAAVRKAMQRRRLKRETTVAREEAGSNMAKYRELQTRPLRIVHVDDGDAVLQFVAHSIRSEFDNVVIATFHNGYEALQEVLREEPDLLISDLVRDGLVDGFTLLRLLDSMNVSCPILIASGNLPKAQAEAVQCAGPKLNVTFWPKPFNTSELLEFIRTKINPALLKARGR